MLRHSCLFSWYTQPCVFDTRHVLTHVFAASLVPLLCEGYKVSRQLFTHRMSNRVLLVADGTETALSPSTQAGLACAVVLVVAVAGIMSGLTLGLLTLDRLDLELMMRTGNKKQQQFSRRLMPMVNNPHWVLATLVICNTAAGMALPLCLDRLVNVVVALVLSTTAIVVFGEILPQAICSRYGLSIGGHAAPVVRLLMWITAPISWPIAKALDVVLGKENVTFGKRQIRALVDLHRESTGLGGPLNEEEYHVIQGVLDLGHKKGIRGMTPLDKVFMLSTEDVIDRPTLLRILESGHSRLPVYRGTNRTDIIGLILVKELLAVVGLAEPGSGPVHVKSLRVRDLPALPVETPMTDLLNLFQTGHSHMALLLQQSGSKSIKSIAGSRRISSSRRSTTSGSVDGSHHSSSSTDSDDDSDRSSSFGSSSSSSSSCSGGSEPSSPHSPRSPSKAGRVASSFLQCLSSKKFKNAKVTLHDDDSNPHHHHHQHHHSSRQNSEECPASSTAAVGAATAHDNAVADHQPPDGVHAAADDQVVIELGALGRSNAVAAAVHSAVAAAAPPDVGSSPASDAASAPLPSSPLWMIPAKPVTAALAATPQVQAASPAATAAVPAITAAKSKVELMEATSAADATACKDASTVRRSFPLVWGGAEPVGIITLEDVLEELMQEEIVDETDNEPINARVLTMSLSPGMRRLLLASQQRQAQCMAMESWSGGPTVGAVAAGIAAVSGPSSSMAAAGAACSTALAK